MFYLLLIRDCIEITLFSCATYAFCLWLKTDRNNNILSYFLSYCALSFIAWMAQLQTVSPFLFSYAPIALIIFIIIHEKTLQRNFITLQNAQPHQTEHNDDWLDIILRCTLSSINDNKKVTIIIEQNDALSSFLTPPFHMNATLTKELLDIVLTSMEYNQQKMIWITTHGILKAINTSWTVENNHMYEDALFYSTHTDMILFHTTPLTRMSTLIIDGKEFSSLSAQNLRMLIKKQVTTTTHQKNKGKAREHNKTEKSLSL